MTRMLQGSGWRKDALQRTRGSAQSPWMTARSGGRTERGREAFGRESESCGAAEDDLYY